MRKKKGKYLAPRKPLLARQPASRSSGNYRRRTKMSNEAIRVLLRVFTVVFCVSAIALVVCLLHLSKARSDFQKLSAMVQDNVQESTPASNSSSPETLPQETVSPVDPEETEPTQPQMLSKFVQIYERNTDLFGWLRIDGTPIDYPVMYTPDDPEKYLHKNYSGEYSFDGIPFLDGKCTADSDNLIIYSHNMLDGSMFANLMKYRDKSYWQEHPTIHFDTLYEEQEYEVLAAFYDRVYYQNETCFKFYKFINAADEADFDNAIANYHEKQLYDTGVTASYGDKLITLVTCAYHVENGRFVVVARKK